MKKKKEALVEPEVEAPVQEGEPEKVHKVNLREAMSKNPQGTKCSVCGHEKKKDRVDGGVKASICSVCLAKNIGEARQPRQPNEPKVYKPKKKGCCDAVLEVLQAAGGKPLHAKVIAERIRAGDLYSSPSTVTPLETLINSSVSGEIKKAGDKSRFTKTAPCTFKLR